MNAALYNEASEEGLLEVLALERQQAVDQTAVLRGLQEIRIDVVAGEKAALRFTQLGCNAHCPGPFRGGGAPGWDNSPATGRCSTHANRAAERTCPIVCMGFTGASEMEPVPFEMSLPNVSELLPVKGYEFKIGCE